MEKHRFSQDHVMNWSIQWNTVKKKLPIFENLKIWEVYENLLLKEWNYLQKIEVIKDLPIEINDSEILDLLLYGKHSYKNIII